MAATLVTGATGLVGSHVARHLVERGDDVRVTVRQGSLLDNLEGLGVRVVPCDVLDRRAVRRARDYAAPWSPVEGGHSVSGFPISH